MAGLAGFEPTGDGVKVRCLTAWRQPNILNLCKLLYLVKCISRYRLCKLLFTADYYKVKAAKAIYLAALW